MSRAVLVLMLIAVSTAWAELPAFYVSPEGNDRNPGTHEQPFRTIEHARDAVREVVSKMDADITVCLSGGTHVLNRPLLLEPKDSGANGHDVIYKAANGEKPVLSGGRAVKKWEPAEGRLWKSRVAFKDLRHLYVNGVRAQRARGDFPKGGDRYGDLTYIDGDAGFTLPDASMAAWRNPTDIEFGFYTSWSHMIGKVQSISREGDGVKIAMQQPNFFLISRKEGVQAQYPAYIENAFELLDEPGEWYFDRPEKTLYYLPRDGEDIKTADVVAPVLDTLVELRGTIEQPVHNVRFEGLTFADATWLAPNRRGHADMQANFVSAPNNLNERDGFVYSVQNEAIRSPANVRLIAAHNVVFDRCTFTRLGGAGLDLVDGSSDNVVRGCIFEDISGSGVQVGGVSAQDHHPSDARRIVRGNRIENNVFRRIGAEYEDSVAVFGGYVKDTVIAHNEICYVPYTGVSVGWGWGEPDAGAGNYPTPYKYATPTPAGGNLIEYNHIHHMMLRRNDGGGIYTLSNQPGTIIRGNYIHDNGPGGGPGGIYLDEGSGFIEITGNCVHDVPTAMNYNNRVQDRIATCNEHDNFFDVKPGKRGFPKKVVKEAGLEPAYRDLAR